MTEKRFIEPHKDCRVIKNTKTGETATYYDTEDGLMFLKWLNNLSDENENLKKQNENLKKLNARLQNKIAFNDQHYGERVRKSFEGIEDWARGGF